MRVTSNSFPENLVSSLQRLTGRMNTLQNQTSTGQRISRVSDDPAAAMRMLTHKGERGKIAQYHRNAMRAEDIVNATTAEIRNLLKVSERANEMISLSSDVQGPTALRAYGTELDALLEQALVNANANFNEEPLFGGTTANARPFTAVRDASGRITSITYDGSAATASFQVAEGSLISPYASFDTNQRVLGFLDNIVALRDAFQSGVDANVKALSATMQGSEDDLITTLSGQGAMLQRLEVETAENSTRYADLAEQISRDGDIDLAQAVVQLTQNQNAYQAALMSASKVLDKSLLDYV
jgi:flagellar hook-associated protein 3 FlgL